MGTDINDAELAKDKAAIKEILQRLTNKNQQDVLETLLQKYSLSPSPKTSSTTTALSYRKAVETKLFQAKEMQIQVWAELAAHEDLSVRFCKWNKLLSLPSAIFSAVTACFSITILQASTQVKEGYKSSKEDCTGSDLSICGDFNKIASSIENTSPHLSWIVISLSVIITIMLAINSHFDFGGLAAAHRESSKSLMRFDKRLETFIQRLMFRSNQHSGMARNYTTNSNGDSTEETLARGDTLYDNLIEDVLEQYVSFSNEHISIRESAPDLKGSFTSLKTFLYFLMRAILCCRCSKSASSVDELNTSTFDQNKNGTLVEYHEVKCRERQANQSKAENAIAHYVINSSSGIELHTEP